MDATNDDYILFGKTRIYLSNDDVRYNSRAEIVQWIEEKVKSRRRWILKKKTSSGNVETIKKKRKNRPHRDVEGAASLKDSNLTFNDSSRKEKKMEIKTEVTRARVVRRCFHNVLSERSKRFKIESGSMLVDMQSHFSWSDDKVKYKNSEIRSCEYNWKSQKLLVKCKPLLGTVREDSGTVSRQDFWSIRAHLKRAGLIEKNTNEKSHRDDMAIAF